MFSFLGIINGWIGYINMNIKVKNRIYTILAALGNLYILYVAYRFFENGFLTRGFLFILAFFLILYFCYLNFVYYFTSKKAKFDITPFLDEKFHLHLKETAQNKEPQHGFIQTNGIFSEHKLLPASVYMGEEAQVNIQMIVQELAKIKYLKLNYAGFDDAQILKEAKNEPEQKYYALPTPVVLPYFELIYENAELVIYGGLNQMDKKRIGCLHSVGLLPVKEAHEKYELYLATVALTGGPYKYVGRKTVITKEEPYEITVQVAYRDRNEINSDEK
ncbi:DUF6681 family protein [Ligilactobacillus ceti]|uniref:Uncharacterized protein n=1 Tax=Ligilactobacillus ceti DSM 22408 TaxID=1122146 RepID=A0A0R2KKQ1_9LACO|nr:DUF6681 family protein [Ligilactobacillus ceti]KRN88358.1 hypothetical protein IV53_GL000322 [Ligilactobacillus ceti DSM 22408]